MHIWDRRERLVKLAGCEYTLAWRHVTGKHAVYGPYLVKLRDDKGVPFLIKRFDDKRTAENWIADTLAAYEQANG